VTALFFGWLGRLYWIRHVESEAIAALSAQGLRADRHEYTLYGFEDWLARLKIAPPEGPITAVSNTWSGSRDGINDLSPLNAFPQLETFSIHRPSGQVELSDSAQQSLFRTSAFPQLRVFRVELQTTLPDEFFERFSQSPELEEMAVLNPPLTDDGLRFLAACTKLKSLSIPKSRVHRGLNSLSLKSLERLNALDTAIDSNGLEGLRGCMQLERVILSGTAVDDVGLENLAGLPMLAYLNLDRTQVTRAGLERLLKTAEPQGITVTNTSVTVDDAMELSKGRKLTIIVGKLAAKIAVAAGAIKRSEDPFGMGLDPE
jgi:hypothetical protein